jgi:hypothetical protein
MNAIHEHRNDFWITEAVLGSALAIWFAFALVMGAQGHYVASPGNPPLALGLAVVLPIVAFALVYNLRGAVWQFCQTLDLRLVVVAHTWRIVGIDFLVNSANGRLPAGFALPAGIGDIVIGVTAIPLALAIARGWGGTRKWFVAWNVLGMLDLVTAVSMGILYSASAFGVLAGSGPTTLIMSQIPRSLVPTFLVPLFFLLHLLALARRKEVGPQVGR